MSRKNFVESFVANFVESDLLQRAYGTILIATSDKGFDKGSKGCRISFRQ